MKIKRIGDPAAFEYWCFGLRVALRLALAILLINVPLYFASDIFSKAREYLANYSSPTAATWILIVAGIIIYPYLFAVIGSFSYRLQDNVSDDSTLSTDDRNVAE